jgi:hypothetical protein
MLRWFLQFNRFAGRHARPAAATVALAAISGGLYLERPSLALIVPGTLVFASLAWTHLRGGSARDA